MLFRFTGLWWVGAIVELVRLDAFPQSYMPPPEIAVLCEKRSLSLSDFG